MGNLISSYEYNEDLVGFIVTFKSGSVAQTQFTEETNRLHADHGEKSLERYTEYDQGALTDDEEHDLELFISDNAGVKAKDAELNA